MWPRILLELLPHVTRLVPAADKFLASRSASEKAHQEALAALAESIRTQVSGVNEGQVDLRLQLQEQNAQMTQLGGEMARARLGVESLETRLAKLEQASQTASRLLATTLILLAAIAILAVLILVKLQAH